jgi:hypothetical protein
MGSRRHGRRKQVGGDECRCTGGRRGGHHGTSVPHVVLNHFGIKIQHSFVTGQVSISLTTLVLTGTSVPRVQKII